MLEPYYDSYTAMIQMAGGVRRPVTLRAPDFRLDLDELRAAVGPRTRFVLLNSPHNPTGTVLTRAELQAVADVAIEHDLVVITDEVYEHLVFDDHEHVPLATLPGMFERTLTLSSAGKSYSFTGWKVGWATGPAAAGRRGARRQAVADLHLRLAAPAGGRARARRRAGLPGELRRQPPGAPRPALRRAWPRSASTSGSPRAPTSRSPTSATSAGRTGWRSASPCPSGPAWSPSPRRASTTTGRRPAPGALGVLQGGAGHRGGPAPGWRGARPDGVAAP